MSILIIPIENMRKLWIMTLKRRICSQEEFERERKIGMVFLQLLSRFGEKENKAK